MNIHTCSMENPFPQGARVSRATIRDAILFLQSEGVRVRLVPGFEKVTVDALFNCGRLRKVGVLQLIEEAHRRGMTPHPVQARPARGNAVKRG